MVFLRDDDDDKEREMGLNGVERKEMDLVVVKKGGREMRQPLVVVAMDKGLVREEDIGGMVLSVGLG